MFHLQVDVVGPLLLNASLLLVLTTDYSDWLVQVDVVGPLLLNASLLLVLTTDYSVWLVQVTQLIDSWQWRESFEFWLIIRLFIVEKHSIFNVYVHRWHRLFVYFFLLVIKFLTALIFLIAINSLQP